MALHFQNNSSIFMTNFNNYDAKVTDVNTILTEVKKQGFYSFHIPLKNEQWKGLSNNKFIQVALLEFQRIKNNLKNHKNIYISLSINLIHEIQIDTKLDSILDFLNKGHTPEIYITKESYYSEIPKITIKELSVVDIRLVKNMYNDKEYFLWIS